MNFLLPRLPAILASLPFSLCALPMVEWGQPGGETSIVSSTQAIPGGRGPAFDPTQPRNPAVGASYYPSPSGRSPIFHAAYAWSVGNNPTVQVENGADALNHSLGGYGNGESTLTALYFWDQAGAGAHPFLNGMATGNVALDPMGSFRVEVSANNNINDQTVRFVIRRGNGYFISDAVSTVTGSSYSTIALPNPTAANWNRYEPTTDITVIGVPDVPPDFENITGVGVWVRSVDDNATSSNTNQFRIRHFAADGVYVGPGGPVDPVDPDPPGEPDPRPNIIFIIADDLGIDGVGAYGSDRFAGMTPEVDSLANPGIRFNWCYATAVCSPTRTEFQTGQDPFRNGCISIDNTSVVPKWDENPSISKMLQDAGYVTALCGKRTPGTGTTSQWGWSEWLSTGTGLFWGGTYNVNGTSVGIADKNYRADGTNYIPGIMHDWALDFIDRQHAAAKPFFLYYSLIGPHIDVQSGSPWNGEMPPTPDSADPFTTNQRQLYDDNIAYQDKLVGELLDRLVALGIRDNTIICFTADNGTFRGPSGVYASTIGGRSLQGSKRSYENGGAHVPLLVSWPAEIQTAEVVDDLVDFTDFLPTFAEVAEATLPTQFVLDGVSFAPRLRGEGPSPREFVFVQAEWTTGIGDRWYLRGPRYRLDANGTLWDMIDAPFTASLVPADTTDPEAVAARERYRAHLDAIDPGSGISYEYHKDLVLPDSNPYVVFKDTWWSGRERLLTPTTGDFSDPDGDGIVNLLENEWNLNPRVPDAVEPPSIGFEEGRLVARFRRLSRGVATVRPTVSSDLAQWSSGSGHTQATTVGDETVVSDLENNATAPRRFMRLEIERP